MEPKINQEKMSQQCFSYYHGIRKKMNHGILRRKLNLKEKMKLKSLMVE